MEYSYYIFDNLHNLIEKHDNGPARSREVRLQVPLAFNVCILSSSVVPHRKETIIIIEVEMTIHLQGYMVEVLGIRYWLQIVGLLMKFVIIDHDFFNFCRFIYYSCVKWICRTAWIRQQH